MIRLIYWLIKRRWAVCRECKYYSGDYSCKKYKRESLVWRIVGGKTISDLCPCFIHNRCGICWGFKPTGHVEPSEPWPRY